jgi:hypothetical protein
LAHRSGPSEPLKLPGSALEPIDWSKRLTANVCQAENAPGGEARCSCGAERNPNPNRIASGLNHLEEVDPHPQTNR